MTIEGAILITAWVITAILLWRFVPRDKIRNAQVVFLFKQLITWITGLVVAQYSLIVFPVRLFPNATTSSFTFDYFFYPAICVFFNLYYPDNKSWYNQLFHYLVYAGGLTIMESIFEHYTQLIKYINWSWYWTFITLVVTFFFSRIYYRWFFRLGKTT